MGRKEKGKAAAQEDAEPHEPRTGRGRFRLATARGEAVYEGEWALLEEEPPSPGEEAEEAAEAKVQTVQHGEGRMVYEDSGESFEGRWEMGEMAEGMYSLPSGDFYVGGLKEGTFHGQGKLVKVNGDSYEGFWEAGVMHGDGRLELAEDNTIWEGRFDHGQFTGSRGALRHLAADPKEIPVTLRHLLQDEGEEE